MHLPQRPSSDFYPAFVRLNPADTRDFQVLIEDDELFESLVHDCAKSWREQLSGRYLDRILRRIAFLSRSILVSAKECISHESSAPVAVAFALYALPHCRIVLHQSSDRTSGRLEEIQSGGTKQGEFEF